MSQQELINYLDEMLFSYSGKHLDDLQLSILTGVLNNQKYSEIAEQSCCTTGHIRDKAYELWRTLSELLGENIRKSNFKSTIQRLKNIKNNSSININSKVINPVQIASINLCSNSKEKETKTKTKKKRKTYEEKIEFEIKSNLVIKLLNLGLSNEQISSSLDLNIDEIEEIISENLANNLDTENKN